MTKWVVSAIAITLLVAGYLGSPYWMVHLRSAAEAGQGNRPAQYVDFPSVRESFEAQAAAMISQPMQSDGLKNNPFPGFEQMLAAEAMKLDSGGRIASVGPVLAPINDGTLSLSTPQPESPSRLPSR